MIKIMTVVSNRNHFNKNKNKKLLYTLIVYKTYSNYYKLIY